MSVTATTAAPVTKSTAQDATTKGIAGLADNFNTFLALLTTQLKNQDPTSPLDSNQFTQQLVQMTGVEQQLNGNTLLKQLVANTSNGISTAVTLIGKTVKAASDNANLTNGTAQWVYNLPSGASDLKVEVLDSNGNVVHAEAPTDLKAGEHAFSWNGKNLLGTQLPNGGTYALRVTAKDAVGATMKTTTYVQGVVTGVTQANGATNITVNGGPVDWSKVVSVEQAAQAANTNTAPATT
ncbi:flagellar hook assembly protein FlgD [Phenylobacterium sp.]|uniref:flagellar hook assembly protein FlgD n=1 Tax=Phenylobacterium sp. TaxID=1871053 RepID=UPI00374C8A26